MSRQNVLLAASLLLNAGLAVFLAMPAATAPPRGSPELPAAASQNTANASATSAATDLRATAKGAGADSAIPTAAHAERARSIHGVRGLVAELRRRGVDEGTVRRLGVAHAERLYRLEARALLSPREKLDYWQAPADVGRFGWIEPAQLREFQRMRRERLETLDELFGDVEAEATEHNTVNHYVVDSGELNFEYAPLEKRLALTEFFEREAAGIGRTPLQRLLSQQMPSGGRELEYSEEIRDILGPDLYDEYLLKSSGVSTRLRHELAAMQPTRAEFDQLVRAEYGLMREQSETLANLRAGPGGGARDPASVEKLEAARKEIVRDVLDDARYADYERSRDASFGYLDMVARELGLGTSAARSAFAHVERARKQVSALFPDGATMEPKAMDAFRKIRNETQTRVAGELGLQGLSESEQRMVLGPALNIHPQQVAQRMFRWY